MVGRPASRCSNNSEAVSRKNRERVIPVYETYRITRQPPDLENDYQRKWIGHEDERMERKESKRNRRRRI